MFRDRNAILERWLKKYWKLLVIFSDAIYWIG